MRKILFLIACGAALFGSCDSDIVKIALDYENKNAPARKDEITTFNALVCENDELYYEYALNDADDLKFSELSDTQKLNFSEYIEDAQINEACNDGNVRSLMQEVNAVNFIYRLQSGEILAKIAVKTSDCKGER